MQKEEPTPTAAAASASSATASSSASASAASMPQPAGIATAYDPAVEPSAPKINPEKDASPLLAMSFKVLKEKVRASVCMCVCGVCVCVMFAHLLVSAPRRVSTPAAARRSL